MTTDSYGLSVHQFLHKNRYLFVLCPCVAGGRLRSSRFLTTGPIPDMLGFPLGAEEAQQWRLSLHIDPFTPMEAGICLARWWWWMDSGLGWPSVPAFLGSGRVPRSGRLETQQEPHPN